MITKGGASRVRLRAASPQAGPLGRFVYRAARWHQLQWFVGAEAAAIDAGAGTDADGGEMGRADIGHEQIELVKVNAIGCAPGVGNRCARGYFAYAHLDILQLDRVGLEGIECGLDFCLGLGGLRHARPQHRRPEEKMPRE